MQFKNAHIGKPNSQLISQTILNFIEKYSKGVFAFKKTKERLSNITRRHNK